MALRWVCMCDRTKQEVCTCPAEECWCTGPDLPCDCDAKRKDLLVRQMDIIPEPDRKEATVEELREVAQQSSSWKCPRCKGDLDCVGTREVETSYAYEYECVEECGFRFDWWHSLTPDCLSPRNSGGEIEVPCK